MPLYEDTAAAAVDKTARLGHESPQSRRWDEGSTPVTEVRVGYRRRNKGRRSSNWVLGPAPDPLHSALLRHTTGMASPWCADRLPSDISKMAVSTVSGGGPKWTIDGAVFEMWLGTL